MDNIQVPEAAKGNCYMPTFRILVFDTRRVSFGKGSLICFFRRISSDKYKINVHYVFALALYLNLQHYFREIPFRPGWNKGHYYSFIELKSNNRKRSLVISYASFGLWRCLSYEFAWARHVAVF